MDTTEMSEPVGMVGSGSGARIVQASSSQSDFSSLAYHSPHQYGMYSTGDAADFAMPQQFPQEFPSYPTPDAHWNVAAHSTQHLHGQNFVAQDGLPQFGSQYPSQVQIPQQQQQFSNTYSSATQPTTIAPSQLGGNSFSAQTATVSPSELWTDSQTKQSQPNTRARQRTETVSTRSVSAASAGPLPSPIKVKGCPWITVVTTGVDPLMIRALSGLFNLCKIQTLTF